MNFYKHYYAANNTSLVLVGNITFLKAKAIAEQLSAALPKQKTSISSTAPQTFNLNSQTRASCQKVNFPSAQANILIGGIGITHKDADFFPLIIGNHIVGGSALTSRLFQEVRNKKGLAYSVHSGFMLYKERGPFLISLQSRNEKAGEAIRIAQETLSQFIQEGPNSEELASAKRNLIGKFNINLASNNAIADALSNLAFYQLPLDYFDTYAKKIQAVTAEQIRQAMQKHLPPNQLSIVIIGKAQCPA
jgi:zinc protease